MKCRHCKTELKQQFVNLEFAPISNAMLTKEQLQQPEIYYPLKIFVCPECFLVQVDEIEKAENIFNEEYTYFSSFSTSWLRHASQYAEMMMERFQFDTNSKVIEIASNDGYLLQYFKKYNISVLGIEPSANTAEAARQKGVETIVDFFSTEFAKELISKGIQADLIVGNNVLAHVPDINNFVGGMKIALKDKGVITMEFPHLMRLVEENQFDTIYHEHFSYLSFQTVSRIFESQGLEMFDVEELKTHGGSLRIFAKHKEDITKTISQKVSAWLEREKQAGMNTMDYYGHFQPLVDEIKYSTVKFLIDQKQKGRKVIGYGAAAKGNTLLNYCGIKGDDLIKFVADASPVKQNKYLPGSHIPVFPPETIPEARPDYIIILPWNLKEEISNQLSYIRDWGGLFVTFIPQLEIF